jgi:surfactin synthase thioesterase subunit
MIAADPSWARVYHPAPAAALRLVCLPHAGGSANFFLPVSAGLTPEFEVTAIQYPGHQDRCLEPCENDLRELAHRVLAALGSADTRPIALFGHSLGATVGFELGRLLEAAGRPVVRLFASGSGAPSRGPARPRSVPRCSPAR